MVAHGDHARAPAGAQRGHLHARTIRAFAALAARTGTTRSAAALELWRDRLAGAVVAIGNAPTALFRLLDMLDAGAPKPAAILGIPVGFVGAAEAKDALAADPRGVPFLIVRGRMGGSAMTAAAVNALARAGLMSAAAAARKLLGVGVGPGDPELMTLKAMRALGEADVVAHFAKAGNASHSRAIAAQHLRAGRHRAAAALSGDDRTADDAATAIATPSAISTTSAAAKIAAHLEAGRVVAVICEGDPLFYGSYMHLHARLAPRFPTEIVAGVTGMSGCWSAAGMPIAQGDDVFTVLPGDLAGRRAGAAACATPTPPW